MRTMRNLLAKKAVVTVLAVGVSLAAVKAFWGGSDSALSQLGSSGSEVRAIQERLKERGLFNDSVTGYYGEKTKAAVIKFQKQQGIVRRERQVRRRFGRLAFLSALCRRLRSRISIFWRG